ncbi:hypothetical protein [Nocardia sp. NPDC051570]|uniref:hypothetical protein n=1 Tax=Nocardia sp. NPDC051570 TaxID=3364324 RepID=UPI0037AE12C3
MVQRVEVRSDELRRAAELMAQIGAALDSAHTGLGRILTAAGTPWSDDGYGSTFYGGDGKNPGYGAGRDSVLKGLGDLVTTVSGYSTNMRTAADDLDGADDYSAATLTRR